mgnify:CR=1 FL=1
MQKAFEDATFALAVGELSQPIHTDSGDRAITNTHTPMSRQVEGPAATWLVAAQPGSSAAQHSKQARCLPPASRSPSSTRVRLTVS